MHPKFDTRDRQLLDTRIENRLKLTGPLVGDFVVMRDGTTRRFTHDWGDGIQTTCAKNYGESFYLEASGRSSYSGGLDPRIAKNRLHKTFLRRMGAFWFFHHNHSTAHNGVNVKAPCSVYRETT